MRRVTLSLLFLAGVGVGVGLLPRRQVLAATPPAVVPDAEYAALLTEVRPKPGEDTFATIPWLTSLWDARVKAAAEGKPILLWEMDGHPLGCG